jgi:cyclophilin family peptidyl-prolyl cis-trans isomerase
MRWFALRFWGLGNRRGSKQSRPRTTGHKRRRRLEFDCLEDRLVLSNTTFGVLSGTAFVDHNGNGALDPGEVVLKGVSVTLAATDGSGVSQTTTTDSTGMFAFRDVPLAGTYALSIEGYLSGAAGGINFSDSSGSGGSITSPPMVQGQGIQRGLDPHFITADLFLNSTTQANFPGGPAGSPANSAPFVKNPIANVVVAENAAATQIDLAGAFFDNDIANSTIRMTLNTGQALNIQLFDTTAPQTVANFMDYVDSGAYGDSFFHRLSVSNPDVLQGGGFTFDPNTSSINTIPALPAVPNEFGASNVANTIAMAATGTGVETDQFYFNVGDNSAGLDPGKFTVFGQLESAADDALLQMLGQTTVRNQSNFNSNFATIPLNNYAGANNDPGFPGNSSLSNYIAINNIQVTSQNEFLTYSVVSNSNPGLVSATLANEHLTLSYLANQTGTSTITVQATDQFGASAQTSFQVTVVPLTMSPVAGSVNVTNEKNFTVSGTATPGASVSVTATDTATSSAQAVTTSPVTVTADATTGAWMASVNVGSLKEGAITFTASTKDATSGKSVSVTQPATKNTAVPNLSISSANVTNLSSTSVTGNAPAGAQVNVTASDGTNPPVTGMATADGTTGVWTASGIDISGLKDGLITYTATTTVNGNPATTTTQVVKGNTVTAPSVFITGETNPITGANQSTVVVSGTATPGASISVVASDGTTSTTPVVATADVNTGVWTAPSFNASSLTNGLITYTATATVGGDTNTAAATAQASKQP